VIPGRDIPVLPPAEFRAAVLAEVAAGARIAALFGVPPGPSGTGAADVRAVAVLARGDEGSIGVLAMEPGGGYPSLTPDCPQAHLFERALLEEHGVHPAGHPWLKPVRFPPGADGTPRPDPGVAEYFAVEGEEIHEVAVGPVHAGIIEPGHFRFQANGETVLHLEISLGYQHRGARRAFIGGPGRRALAVAETVAGDTTVGHAMAHCAAIEALAGCRVPPRAEAIRGIALELERIANHIGDLGALAGDIGFMPTAAHCGRIRGDVLNSTALLCGNRFGRGLVRPGGVRHDLETARAQDLADRLRRAVADAAIAADLFFESPSVLARLERTGTIDRKCGVDLGLVGLAARACGLERDARQEFPAGIYRFSQIPVSLERSGDVFARACVRWLEIRRSAAFIEDCLKSLPEGPVFAEPGPLAPSSWTAAVIEGWRGEIWHVALTDGGGRFGAYEIIDPSFHNWMGLAVAMRGGAISDFPLCNKSFNLSYCGHDL